jgi:hypothetical protein
MGIDECCTLPRTPRGAREDATSRAERRDFMAIEGMVAAAEW